MIGEISIALFSLISVNQMLKLTVMPMVWIPFNRNIMRGAHRKHLICSMHPNVGDHRSLN